MNALNVKSAARVLDLLELFSVATEPMGVSEASRVMGIPKSSGQGLLSTLTGRGYLVKTVAGYEMNGTYRAHGWVGGSLSALRNFAEPLLERLAGETGESAFLSVMTPGFEVKYVAKAISPHLVRYDAPLRGTREAYCSSRMLRSTARTSLTSCITFRAMIRPLSSSACPISSRRVASSS